MESMLQPPATLRLLLTTYPHFSQNRLWIGWTARSGKRPRKIVYEIGQHRDRPSARRLLVCVGANLQDRVVEKVVEDGPRFSTHVSIMPKRQQCDRNRHFQDAES